MNKKKETEDLKLWIKAMDILTKPEYAPKPKEKYVQHTFGNWIMMMGMLLSFCYLVLWVTSETRGTNFSIALAIGTSLLMIVGMIYFIVSYHKEGDEE